MGLYAHGILKIFMYLKKNCMAPFYGWGSTASRLEPLRGGSLLFTTKFPEISGTHFTDLGRMKGWVDLGATQWFWAQDCWIGNPVPWPLGHCPMNNGALVHRFLLRSLYNLIEVNLDSAHCWTFYWGWIMRRK